MKDTLLGIHGWIDNNSEWRVAQNKKGDLSLQAVFTIGGSWRSVDCPDSVMSRLVSNLGYVRLRSGRWVLPKCRDSRNKGLPELKYKVFLAALSEHGPCTSRTVADRLDKHIAEVSAYMRYLVKLGLATRFAPDDGSPYVYRAV